MILGDAPGLGSALEAALSTDRIAVCQLIPAGRNRIAGGHRYEVDVSSAEAIRQVHESIAGSEGKTVGAIVNLLGISAEDGKPACDLSSQPLEPALGLLKVIQEFEADLRLSAKRGGGWLFNFTTLDGKFGLSGRGPLPVAQAALVGMCKVVHREWPELWVKNIDLDRRMDPHMMLSLVAEEMECDDGLVEVGICENARWRIALCDAPLGNEAANRLEMDGESVVLATGGAYGITAEVLKQLARAAAPKLVLVGRSRLPGPEPAALRDLADAGSLRRHLIEVMRREDPGVLPAQVENRVQRILKDRQMRANIAAMQAAGSAVEYHALDVRNHEEFGDFLDSVYARHGRLDGVIHAAGIIEDGLISRKTGESFARVFGTKVDPAVVLANKLRLADLRFLVFFSSISARFGNAGQVDYAAANEYLNKLATHLGGQTPGRVVAINWGPWEGGMISDSLRRLYQSKGIHLISMEQGARFFVEELKRGRPGEPEVIAACGIGAMVDAG